MAGIIPGGTSWKDYIGVVSVALALLGLVWNAAGQVADNEQQTRDIERIERKADSTAERQGEDRVAVGRIETGVKYLVDQQKEREARR